MNAFEAAMRYRRATKFFQQGKKIPAADLHSILEAGRLSPSSYGLEPWHFLVIESDAVRQQLKPACYHQPQITTASHFIVVLFARAHLFTKQHDYMRSALRRQLGYNEYGIDQRCDQFNEHMMQNARETIEDWAQMQCHMASANMMTAAAFLRIDSCAIGGFNYRALEATLREYIPNYNHKDYGVSHGLALGYRNDEPSPQIRWPLDKITTFI